ncbi:hypothetical protein ACE6H2_008778 [Prunus campanulata]
MQIAEVSCIEMLRWWDHWVEEALQKLEHLQLLRSLRLIYLQNGPTLEALTPSKMNPMCSMKCSRGTDPLWRSTFLNPRSRNGSTTFPVPAALEHGMGLRGSALICGYTDYHGRLESCIADLKKKEIKLHNEEESRRD